MYVLRTTLDKISQGQVHAQAAESLCTPRASWGPAFQVVRSGWAETLVEQRECHSPPRIAYTPQQVGGVHT